MLTNVYLYGQKKIQTRLIKKIVVVI